MGSNPILLPKYVMRDIKNETNSGVFKKAHRKEIAKKVGGCDRCPPHAKENAQIKGKKPKPDKHKNKSRATVRKEA